MAALGYATVVAVFARFPVAGWQMRPGRMGHGKR